MRTTTFTVTPKAEPSATLQCHLCGQNERTCWVVRWYAEPPFPEELYCDSCYAYLRDRRGLRRWSLPAPPGGMLLGRFLLPQETVCECPTRELAHGVPRLRSKWGLGRKGLAGFRRLSAAVRGGFCE